MGEKVKLEKDGVIATITIQNPPFNELSGDVLLNLGEALADAKNDENIKAVIITGGRIFSIGADVLEIYNLSQLKDQKKIEELLEKANGVVNAIANFGKIAVAAINGFCLGGGNEIAMACHYRIATGKAKFGQPEIKLGIIPGMGGTQRLPRLVDIHSAMSLLLTGDSISAEKAKEIGLINGIAAEDKLLQTAREFINAKLQAADRLPSLENYMELKYFTAGELFTKNDFWELLKNRKDHKAALAIVEAVRLGLPKQLSEALKIEQELFAEIVLTKKAQEGIENTLLKLGKIEKEKPAPEPATVVSAAKDDKTGELRMIRDAIREFAVKEIEPMVSQMEKDGNVPQTLISKMAELGFFGVPFEERYGGIDLGKTGYCVLMEELSRVHGSTAAVVGAHVGLSCMPIHLFGNEGQKEKYLRAGIDGKMLGAFALTEPNAGSDAFSLATTAIKQENGSWILNGAKQFITNGDTADFYIVFVQTDKKLDRDHVQEGIAAFIVERAWEGVECGKPESKMGLHASRTTSVTFSNVRVPDENRLGQVGQAYKIAMTTLNGGRVSLAAGCLGGAKGAFEKAYNYATQRVQFGKSLLEFEMIQGYFAEMRAKIHLMETGVYHAAQKADRGMDFRMEAAILKLTCSEMAWEVVNTALQILGGYGYIEEYGLERMVRDMRVNLIFEGTNEIQKLDIIKNVVKNGGVIDPLI